MDTKNKVNPPVNFVDILPYKGRLTYAFSLIELSIVLIIIGLLVAGVTGGKSLIDSAKARALINELREYERAVWTFRAARDRWPGDVMNYGKFGIGSEYETNYEYKATDFPSDFITEFRKTAGDSAVPDVITAPIAELYIENIINFKPLVNFSYKDNSDNTTEVEGGIELKSNPKALTYYRYIDSNYDGDYCNNMQCNLKNNSQIQHMIASEIFDYRNIYNVKIIKSVDSKLDDGVANTGRVRANVIKLLGDNSRPNYVGQYDDGNAVQDIYYLL